MDRSGYLLETRRRLLDAGCCVEYDVFGYEGYYSVEGSLADGQIIVNTEDKEVVRLILNGVDIRNTTGAAINITNAKKTVIILADNTTNTITDGDTYAGVSAADSSAKMGISRLIKGIIRVLPTSD